MDCGSVDIGNVSMQIAPVAVLVGAVLLALGALFRAPFSVAFFAALAFGSTSIVTLAGSSILLYVPLAGLLVAAAAFRRTFWRDLGRVFRLNWTPIVVFALLVYGVASAFVLPRLFAGATTVFVPARGAIVETALRPVSGNINQAAYFTMGIAAFFAIAGQLARDGRFDVLRIGFFAYACAHTLLGLIDLAGKASGAGDLLAPLRTAGFTMLIEIQVEGFWRIVGAYSEASTFAGGSVLALAFTFSYWRETNWRPALVVASVVLVLLLLCTSSTGYVSLALLGAMLSASWLWRLLAGRLSSRDLATILAGTVALVLVLAVFVFSQDLLKPVQKLIEETLINKSTSASADERFYWNYKSWLAFFDTYGLGVGLGSSRASSSVVAVLSQLGALGALLILLLLADAARPIPRPGPDPAAQEIAAITNSLRIVVFASVIPAAIAGGGADPGIVFFIALAGVVVGRHRLQRLRAEERSGSAGAARRPAWKPVAGSTVSPMPA